MRTGPICISEPTKTTRCKYTQPRKERGKGSGLMTLPWGSQPPVGGSALISLTDTPPHPRNIHIKVREKKRERENGAGGGVLQGKGPFPSSVWDPWWNRAAQGAGLLKNRSKVKRIQRGTSKNRKSRIENRKPKNRNVSFSFSFGWVEAGAAAVLLSEFILCAHH